MNEEDRRAQILPAGGEGVSLRDNSPRARKKKKADALPE